MGKNELMFNEKIKHFVFYCMASIAHFQLSMVSFFGLNQSNNKAPFHGTIETFLHRTISLEKSTMQGKWALSFLYLFLPYQYLAINIYIQYKNGKYEKLYNSILVRK